MAPDFPVELWLEILTYLPHGFVRNMAGVSRTCYELAMDDIYKELELVSADSPTFRRIQFASRTASAQRVQRLCIRSSFLPTKVTTVQRHIVRPKTACRLRVALERFFAFRRLAKRDLRTPRNPPSGESEEEVTEYALRILATAFPHFIHLEEVTVLLHEFPVTTYFHTFLGKLWSARGSCIRRFEVVTPLNKVSLFLEPLLNSRVPFPNLESLSVSLVPSRDVPLHNPGDLCKMIAAFIGCHRTTLHTFKFSAPALLDLSPLFRDLGYFPHLRQLGLLIYTVEASLSDISSLRTFLRQNSAKLERLLLRQKATFFGPGIDETYWCIRSEVLPSLSFPVLSELDIDCVKRPFNDPSRPLPAFSPQFQSFAPKLKHLTVVDGGFWKLVYSEFEGLLRYLSVNNLELTYLRVPLHILSPAHMDEIAIRLPGLQALDISYTTLGILPTVAMDISRHTVRSAIQSMRDKFHSRKYDQWSLKYLRISRKSDCGEGHPVPYVNKIIASSIPRLETLDSTQTCFCRNSDFHNIMQ